MSYLTDQCCLEFRNIASLVPPETVPMMGDTILVENRRSDLWALKGVVDSAHFPDLTFELIARYIDWKTITWKNQA
jgi:hypothetical protein